jgi:PAS domain S-box-containing protein
MPFSTLDPPAVAARAIRILHLEDSARDAELIGNALTAGGVDCRVEVVASRQRFEAALRGEAPELILLDYNVAGYDGLAALRAARSALPDVPVIFVSGSLGEEAAIDCLHLGATDYVLKQRLVRLIPAVRRALGEAEQGARRRHAEAELRRSEAELQQAQAVGKLGSWTYDVGSGLYSCSVEAFRIFGIEPQSELVFDDFLAVVHPDDRHLLEESWQSAIIGGLPYELTYRIVVGGEERWIQERAELRYDESGRPTHAVGTAQDVTERERDRIALLASEHFLNATLSAVPDRIVVLDEQGRIHKTNQACRDFLAMVGLPAALMEEGASYYAICDSLADRGIEGGAATAELCRRLLQESGHGRSFEYEVLAAETEHRWFLCRGSSFRIEARPRVVLVHTDITSRKRAEKDLRRLNVQLEQIVARRTADLQYSNLRLASKEEEIRSVVDNLLSSVLSVDEHGTVQSANMVVGQVFGYPVEELVGRSVGRLFAPPHGDLPPERLFGSSGEITGRHRDGSPIPLDLSVNEYRVAGHRRYTMILRDDRERARMLSELKSARDLAEQASRAKSEFLAAMSHEIRTPMNGVIGMIDVLHQTHLRSDQAEMVELMRESAYSLLTVINDILDYSRIEAGRLSVELIPMGVEELVERVCGILDRMAETAGVGLSLFVDPRIPASLVGDPNRVRQVLINLVGNAIKFSGGASGQVAVRVRLIETRDDCAQVEFEVTDNGIGMDAATVSQLFAPFTQADASTTRRFGGSGLGLAIVRRLVDLLGGEISVRSALGEGSTFTVRLPFALAPQPQAVPVPLLDGLECIVVGPAGGLGDSLATYLWQSGAHTSRIAQAGGAAALQIPAGPSVWIIDCGEASLSAPQLRSQLALPAGSDARLVVVCAERARRHPARRVADGVVALDGNALGRRAFLQAVTAVAHATPLGAVEREPPAQPRPAPVTRESALRQGRLILVAEDNETNRRVILAQLQALGCAADLAVDGADALQRWQQGAYGLVLTDLHMPRLDGYQLTAAIRSAEAGARRTPIIALSANAIVGEADRCREVGMDGYLSKPTPLADLRTMLEAWLPAALVTAAPVDVSALEALVGDSPRIVHEVLQDFRARATGMIAELAAGCASADAQGVRGIAHQLKSSARAIGAFTLGDLCARMEQAGRDGDAAALRAGLPALETEMAAVDRYLRSLAP